MAKFQHRISNEYAKVISFVSRLAARSVFPIASVTTAFAQGREQKSRGLGAVSLAPKVNVSASDATSLPSLDSIDAQSDIAAFLSEGAPAGLQLAALRRAWTVNPAICDFRGLRENDRNFNDPNRVPGFGELGPEADTKKIVAEIFVETPPTVAPKRGVFDMALRFLQDSNISTTAIAQD